MRKSPSGVPARHERTRAVLVSEPLGKAFREGACRLPVPAEQAANEKAYGQQRSDGRLRSLKKIPGMPNELGERDSATRAWQIHGPRVV